MPISLVIAPQANRSPRAIFLLLLILFAGNTGNLIAQSSPEPEYRVKAAFLFNFAQFIDWPLAAFRDEHVPLVIGVLGKDPFGAFIDEAVQYERAHNRPLLVQRYRTVDEIKSCHILFISRSEAGRLTQILDSLKGVSILTVADAPGFARLGGMIQFAIEKSRIRLLINIEDIKASNLSISSKLLRLSEIVTPPKG